MSDAIAWVDGSLVARAEARVSIDDFAVRYGAAVFETMRAANGRVFRVEAHLARLRDGLAAMGIAAPAAAALRAAIHATLEANGLRDAAVRLTTTAGTGRAPDLAAAGPPTVIVTVDALPSSPPRPPRLRVSNTVRIDATRPLAAAKSAQFLPHLLARAEARAAGADDALLLNHAGAVCEAATANLFAVIDDVLVTPPLADGPLPGVTRAVVTECAAVSAVTAVERSVALADLAGAGEVFVTSSIAGPVAVAEVRGDGIEWRGSAVPGPVTAGLAAAYEALVRRETGAERA